MTIVEVSGNIDWRLPNDDWRRRGRARWWGEIHCSNYPIHLFSNKRISNKRITIGDVVFLMPGTPKISNKTAPEVLNVSSPPAAKAMGGVPGWQPGVYGLAIKNLEAMREINGWIGIERSIPSDQKIQLMMMMLACISTASGPSITHDGELSGIIMIEDIWMRLLKWWLEVQNMAQLLR